MSSKTFPTLEIEANIRQTGVRYLIAVDEVGRGAIAGPVAVGAVLIDLYDEIFLEQAPKGIADSKLLSEQQREALFSPIVSWVRYFGVGMVSAEEIDRIGIISALAKSGRLAIDQTLAAWPERSELASSGIKILLDGSHDWLGSSSFGIPVVVRPKADRDSLSVATASVLAKVLRDRYMVELSNSDNRFGFESHKGYAAATHIAALKKFGPSEHHRHSWLTKILADGQLEINE
jgi:ribonuclease HII